MCSWLCALANGGKRGYSPGNARLSALLGTVGNTPEIEGLGERKRTKVIYVKHAAIGTYGDAYVESTGSLKSGR